MNLLIVLIVCCIIYVQSSIISFTNLPVQNLPISVTFDVPKEYILNNEPFDMTLHSKSGLKSFVLPISDCISITGASIFTLEDGKFVKKIPQNDKCIASIIFDSSIEAVQLGFDYPEKNLKVDIEMTVLDNFVPVSMSDIVDDIIPNNIPIKHTVELPKYFFSLSDSPLVMEMSSLVSYDIDPHVYDLTGKKKIGVSAVKEGTTIIHLFNHDHTSFVITLKYTSPFWKNQFTFSLPQYNYLAYSSTLTNSPVNTDVITITSVQSPILLASSSNTLLVELTSQSEQEQPSIKDRSFTFYLDPSLSVDISKIEESCYSIDNVNVASVSLSKSGLDGRVYSTVTLTQLIPAGITNNIFKCQLRVVLEKTQLLPQVVDKFFFSRLTSVDASVDNHKFHYSEQNVDLTSAPISVHTLHVTNNKIGEDVGVMVDVNTIIADAYLTANTNHLLRLAFPFILNNNSLTIKAKKGLTCEGAVSVTTGIFCTDSTVDDEDSSSITVDIINASFHHGFAGLTLIYNPDITSLSISRSVSISSLAPLLFVAEVPVKVIDVSNNNMMGQIYHEYIVRDDGDYRHQYAVNDPLFFIYQPRDSWLEDKVVMCYSHLATIQFVIDTSVVVSKTGAKFQLSIVDGCFVVTRLNTLHSKPNERQLYFRIHAVDKPFDQYHGKMIDMQLAGADYVPVSVESSATFFFPSITASRFAPYASVSPGPKVSEFIVTASKKMEYLRVSFCDAITFTDGSEEMEIGGLKCTITAFIIKCTTVADMDAEYVEFPLTLYSPQIESTISIGLPFTTRVLPLNTIIKSLHLSDVSGKGIPKNYHDFVQVLLPTPKIEKDSIVQMVFTGLQGDIHVSGDIHKSITNPGPTTVVGKTSFEIVNATKVFSLTYSETVSNDKETVESAFELSYISNLVRSEVISVTLTLIDPQGVSKNLGSYLVQTYADSALQIITFPVNLIPETQDYLLALTDVAVDPTPVTNSLTFQSSNAVEGKARYSIIGFNLPKSVKPEEAISAVCSHKSPLTVSFGVTDKDFTVYIDLDSVEALSTCTLTINSRISLNPRFQVLLSDMDKADTEPFVLRASLPIELTHSKDSPSQIPSVSIGTLEYDLNAPRESDNEVFDHMYINLPNMDLSKHNKVKIVMRGFFVIANNIQCRTSESSKDLLNPQLSTSNSPVEVTKSTLTLDFPKFLHGRVVSPVCVLSFGINSAESKRALEYVSVEVVHSYTYLLPSEGPTISPVSRYISIDYIHPPILNSPNGLNVTISSLPIHRETAVVLILEHKVFADVSHSFSLFDVEVKDKLVRIKFHTIFSGLTPGRNVIVPIGPIISTSTKQTALAMYDVFKKSYRFPSILTSLPVDFKLTPAAVDKSVVLALTQKHEIKDTYHVLAFHHNLPSGQEIVVTEYLTHDKALIGDVVSDCHISLVDRPSEDLNLKTKTNTYLSAIPHNTVCHYVFSVSYRVSPSDPRVSITSTYGNRQDIYYLTGEPVVGFVNTPPVVLGASLRTLLSKNDQDSDKQGTYLTIHSPFINFRDTVQITDDFSSSTKAMLHEYVEDLEKHRQDSTVKRFPMVYDTDSHTYTYEGNQDDKATDKSFLFSNAFTIFLDQFPVISNGKLPISLSVNKVPFKTEISLDNISTPTHLNDVRFVSNGVDQVGVLRVNVLIPRATDISVVVDTHYSTIGTVQRCYHGNTVLPFDQTADSVTFKFKKTSDGLQHLVFSCIFEKSHDDGMARLTIYDDTNNVGIDSYRIMGSLSGNLGLTTATHSFKLHTVPTVGVADIDVEELKKIYLSTLITHMPEFNGDIVVTSTVNPDDGSVYDITAKITSTTKSRVDSLTIHTITPKLKTALVTDGKYTECSNEKVDETQIFYSCVDRCGVGCTMCDDVDGGKGQCTLDIDCRVGTCEKGVCKSKDNDGDNDGDKDDDDKDNDDDKKPRPNSPDNTVWIVVGVIAAVAVIVGAGVFVYFKFYKSKRNVGTIQNQHVSPEPILGANV